MIRDLIENKTHHLFKQFIDEHTNYAVKEVMGAGAYGITYLLIEKRSGKKYVLKRLKSKHRNSKNCANDSKKKSRS